MRRPVVRPPQLRLLGGRRPRLEGAPSQLAADGRARRPARPSIARRPPTNPFLADLEARDDNPFALKRSAPVNPFALDDDDAAGRESVRAEARCAPDRRPGRRSEAGPAGARPGRLRELRQGAARGRTREEERAAAYAQFGPLSAYPRALRLRELYPRLPQSPLPAVITCVAVTAEAIGAGVTRWRWSSRSARTWPRAASRPSRPTRRSDRRRTPPPPRPLRSGSGRASPSSSPTSATRWSGASSDARDGRCHGLDVGGTISRHGWSDRWSYQASTPAREAVGGRTGRRRSTRRRSACRPGSRRGHARRPTATPSS